MCRRGHNPALPPSETFVPRAIHPGIGWVPFRDKETMLLLEPDLNCAKGVQQAIGKGRGYRHSRI